MIFVASVSPQTRASLAATYGVSEGKAGHMIEQLLSGPQGLKSGGRFGSGFTWVVDTNTLREICQMACVDEVLGSLSQECVARPGGSGQRNDRPKAPILASACPGWICYAEKTHPHVLPHLSRLKSPQALSGTMLKSVLSRRFGIPPDRVWHVAIMPCFDKKLEASREELTDVYWKQVSGEKRGVRDVDCVITARELLMLAEIREISFPNLPRTPLKDRDCVAFPDPLLDSFLFPRGRRRTPKSPLVGGPSGGYAYHVIQAYQRQQPGSEIRIERGRNSDIVEYILSHDNKTIIKTARYYGFRNIQNLVRRLKPQKTSRLPGSRLMTKRQLPTSNGAGIGTMTDYAYVEVMACPGGCTNGGGQIKVSDVAEMRDMAGEVAKRVGPAEQKNWLAQVDEAYYSADSSSEEDDSVDAMDVDTHTNGGGAHGVEYERDLYIRSILEHWSSCSRIELDKLVYTSYRQVESDVGKHKGDDMESVAGLASSLGGGW